MSDKIFDLEQEILDCWRVTTDVKMIYEHIGDSPMFAGMDGKQQDNIINLLLGVTELYELKFDKCFRTFEQVCKEYHARGRANLSTFVDEEDPSNVR